MCLSLARERGGYEKKPQPSENSFSLALPAREVPGKLLCWLLSPCKRPRWPHPVCGQGRLGPSLPADPRGGLLTLSPAHCAAHRSRRWGLMPADTDTMATRMGHEEMAARAAAWLRAGLVPESRGAQVVAVTVAFGARIWAAMLPLACIKAGVKKTGMGSEGLRYSRLRGTGGHGEPAPGIAPMKQHQPPPHPQTRDPFYPPSFLCLLKCLGH